ncbi:MAG: folate-binding protein [Alphaproteobacteria bacterium]|nr:folate-binding protein [Alphaproteobacteria bacterium]
MSFVKLENRGLITLTGPDSKDFLQGLITNDINKLTPETLLYACLLTPQGKFLHDFFISERDDGSLLIDCEGGERAADLAKRLSMYKLRKDVKITAQEDNPVYAGPDLPGGLPDPRHPDMGSRSFVKPDNMPEAPFDEWDYKRITLTIPDGSRDLAVNNSTMDEAHMDQLNAINYQKGCYVGQELTARMHYRGLGKKHLRTVKLDTLPEGAELRSSCREVGIALVRNAEAS